MNILERLREEILPLVNKPGQYLGNEFGSASKDWDSAKSRMALIYPDLYELGMSNSGIKLLYNIVNAHPDYLCDRAYAPMPDMEKLLREKDLSLWGWESGRTLADFDMLGFSLAYELCYTNVLNILDLAKIPLKSVDRSIDDPFVFAGGPAVFNPEPMADFMDFYLVGDGEELITEIQDSLIRSREKASSYADPREYILLQLSKIEGVYVPRFYLPDENQIPVLTKGLGEKYSESDPPYPVKKRVLQDISRFNSYISGLVPNIATVQDKQVIEIRRGCDRACRFCQVGATYLPVRERSPEDILELSKDCISKTGYDGYTLLSLSASDYSSLTELTQRLSQEHSPKGISMSLPSQRADRFSLTIAKQVSQVRKSGMTFAPEAGTERLRKIINKGLRQEEILNAVQGAYCAGWSHIKLYFMIGLPFEEDSDLDGILDTLSELVQNAQDFRRSNREPKMKAIDITCTISTFVPKSFTAFQWFPQSSVEEFYRKQRYLLDGLKDRSLQSFVQLNCTTPEVALLESVMSRGDRRLGAVIHSAWSSGLRLDAWTENFNISAWLASAEEHGLDLKEETLRYREPGSKQVWDVLSIGFAEGYLLREWQKAVEIHETEPCTEAKCHACGVCPNLDVKNRVFVKKTSTNPFVEELEPIVLNNTETDLLTESEKSLGLFKFRLKISKTGDFRFIGNLDFQKVIERAIRRGALPIAYSQGFNQRMRLTWGAALPLFVESRAEYLDIELTEDSLNPLKIQELLNKELPRQVRIESVEFLASGKASSINKVKEVVYTAVSQGLCADQGMVTEFLSRDLVDITKENILSIQLLEPNTIELRLSPTQRADKVLNAFKPGLTWRISKESQVLA